MKPLIGVPCHGELDGRTDVPQRYTLSRSYVEAIRRAGGAVVTIPSCDVAELLRPVYCSLSGLLLAGGGDVAPAVYRRQDAGLCRLVDPERDQAELLLARWAVEDDMPILAICRGIQLLNVALGGTLIQDIPSQVPAAQVHHPGPDQPRAQPQHVVSLVAGSRLAAVFGQGQPLGQVDVNSFHHQAAEDVAPSLRISARAPDGIVEGLECPHRTFVLGVQWHPEDMAPSQPAQQAIFDAFVGACAARRLHGRR